MLARVTDIRKSKERLKGIMLGIPTWVTVCVFLNILLINLFQLLIFKRYDFVSMFSFRLAYYAIWHIAWGYVRLNLLF